MGLAEKRVIKEFESTVYPDLKKKIDEAAGFSVPARGPPDTLAKDEKYSSGWVAGWPKIYFHPMIEAFKQICADDMGKEALKTALKQVVVQNIGQFIGRRRPGVDQAGAIGVGERDGV